MMQPLNLHRMLVAAVLSVLLATPLAHAAPVSLTPLTNYKTYYDVDLVYGSNEGYLPGNSGTSTLPLSHDKSLGAATSQAAILFDPTSFYNYTMQVRTIVDGTQETQALSSAYLSGSYYNDPLAPAQKLYVYYKLDGEALALESKATSYSQVESYIEFNGVTTKYWLGSLSGLYNDNGGPTGDKEWVHEKNVYIFDLVSGFNDVYVSLDAYSYGDLLGSSEGWLDALFTFSTTPLTEPPSNGTVSEPHGIALLALGLIALAGFQRRRRLM